MTREEFDVLVRAVEERFGRDGRALRRRIARLVVVGYAALAGSFTLVFGLASIFFVAAALAGWPGGIFFGLLGALMLLGGSFAIIRGLRVKLEPPKGRKASRAETPGLFEMLDTLADKAGAPVFHEVLFVDDLNAGVNQYPRLGLLGWPRNYLLLGLPLLESLSPKEIEAVLAHEFAHLSGQHGRFGNWVYRSRRSWERLLPGLRQPRVRGEISIRPLVVKFVGWFWPRFNAHAWVLSRSNEYEADAVAARIAGASSVASGLIRLRVHSLYLGNKFWPAIWRLANTEDAPPARLFERLVQGFRDGGEPGETAKWVEEAFRSATTNADTHPCLSDRLRAIGQLPPGVERGEFPAPPAPPETTAARALLGDALGTIRADVERIWRANAETVWRGRRAKASALQSRLEGIEQVFTDTPPDADALWDKAWVILQLEGGKSAEPLLRQVIALRPAHGPANYYLGAHLLQQGDVAGVACLESVIDGAEELLPKVCELLATHYRRVGQPDKIRALSARLDQHDKELALSRTERSAVNASDSFVSHGLAEAELEALRGVLATEPELWTADLARKELRYFKKQRLFVLLVRPRPRWHRLPSQERQRELIARLAPKVVLPGRVLVIGTGGAHRGVARKVAAVEGARVFSRERATSTKAG
jgi:Zn-dependent protease with chaperone function